VYVDLQRDNHGARNREEGHEEHAQAHEDIAEEIREYQAETN
jgi:hypothetical protein